MKRTDHCSWVPRCFGTCSSLMLLTPQRGCGQACLDSNRSRPPYRRSGRVRRARIVNPSTPSITTSSTSSCAPTKKSQSGQILGRTIGVPINYAVVRWVISSKRELLLGNVADPTKQWTGQSISTSLSTSVQYVLVGPKAMFQGQSFKPLPYGFILGVVAPIILFLLHRRFPNSQLKFPLWNTTIGLLDPDKLLWQHLNWIHVSLYR